MRIVLKLRIAARDQLVRIDLMAGIPDQPIVPEIERLVQREAQLDHAQVRREVGAAATHEVAQHLAHLARQPLELRQRQPVQIARRMNRR